MLLMSGKRFAERDKDILPRSYFMVEDFQMRNIVDCDNASVAIL